jgi:hypothetical protein
MKDRIIKTLKCGDEFQANRVKHYDLWQWTYRERSEQPDEYGVWDWTTYRGHAVARSVTVDSVTHVWWYVDIMDIAEQGKLYHNPYRIKELWGCIGTERDWIMLETECGTHGKRLVPAVVKFIVKSRWMKHNVLDQKISLGLKEKLI